MAENITLARPYAQALFDLARTDDQLPAWSAALNIAALVVQDAGASEVLTNPMISDDQRVSLLAGICSEAGGEGGTVFAEVRGQSLLRLLAENGRLSVLPEIAARFNALKAAFENTVEVDLISAVEVDDATADKFKQGLQARLGRSVALNRSVDPQLVGGAIVRADDLVIDGSIKTRLQALAQRLGS
jgi:F-type H+-transporting ATPase subunit delta